MYYTIINEICANKPHRLRRAETIGENDGQTNQSLYWHIQTIIKPSKSYQNNFEFDIVTINSTTRILPFFLDKCISL